MDTVIIAARAQAAARRLTRRAAATAAGACAAAAATLALPGCGTAGGNSPIAHLGPQIVIQGAYVPQPATPGSTVAYLDIRNNGPADRLVSARTSAGGTVSFLAPDGLQDGTLMLKSVPGIPIPPHSTVKMNPGGPRLRITGAGHMHDGKDIVLKLTFAHAGTLSVDAPVTNPDTSGGSYVLGRHPQLRPRLAS